MKDIVTLVLAALIGLLCAARLRPPPANDSSALARAVTDMHEILGSEPRPVGTRAHTEVRHRLGSALTSLGADVSEHPAVSCGGRGRCARVVNVVARIGPVSGASVAVVSHYDSVPPSPGAADDGAGLTIALALAQHYQTHPPAKPLMLILTDGEELGLLGAEALVRDGVLDGVAAMINLEARGTSGPSLLFETAGPNAAAIARFARTAVRPISSSLFDAIYHLLPNDTDLTAFRVLNVPSFNFAFIGDPLDYHTPADRIDRLSLASVAHQGVNVMTLVDSLLEEPLEGNGDAVWFDVLGFCVLWIRRLFVLPIAATALVVLAIGAYRAQVSGRLLALGATLAVLVLLTSAIVGFAISFMVHTGGTSPWRAWTGLVETALIAPGVALGFAIPRLAGVGDRGIIFGGFILGAGIGAALAALLPGAAYLWVVPSLLASPIAAPRGVGWAPIGAGLSALVVWGPLMGLLYVAVGAPWAAAVTVAAAIGTSWLGFAMRSRELGWWVVVGAVAVSVIALAAALRTARHDAMHPAPGNVLVIQDPTGGVTAKMQGARQAGLEPLAGVALPAPRAEIVRHEGDQIWLRVTSARSAPTLGLQWEGDAKVSVGGVASSPRLLSGHSTTWVYGVDTEGVVFNITGSPRRLWVADQTNDLPAGMIRPSDAEPFNEGDRTQVFTAVALGN
jgi:Peptidase family M28